MSSGKIKETKYICAGIDLSRIRNRNEIKVIENMQEILDEYPAFYPDNIAIQDVYALALNMLPARYSQQFSIVLREPVSNEIIRNAIRKALVRVMNNPTDQIESPGPVQW